MKKRKPLSEEHKRKLSEIRKGKKNPFFGKKHTLETKRKISETSKGRKVSLETRRKIFSNVIYVVNGTKVWQCTYAENIICL